MSAAAAAAEPAPADGAAAPVKRGKKKLIVIAAVVLLVVLGLAGGGVFFMKKRAAAHAAAEAAEGGEGKAEVAAKHDPAQAPTYMPLDPFVVNLADKDADRFAQIGVTLEVENAGFADQIKTYMPGIRSAVLMIIAHKSSRELLERSGKEQLADEIQRETIRAMGLELPTPKARPAAAHGEHEGAAASAAKHGASGAEEGASAAAAAPPKGPALPAAPSPVRRVHFSSFIIQ